jgi:hypothetical protein
MTTQQIINIGTLPNDGEGDPLRTAFGKINNNFTQLFSTSYDTFESYSSGNTQGQVIFETFGNAFTQGTFQINSSNPANQDSQNITISAATTNNGSGVRFTGFATLFNGNAVTSYNMDVSGGNVRILANPLIDVVLNHFIAYQITYNTPEIGSLMELDGYSSGNVMATEDIFDMTTES